MVRSFQEVFEKLLKLLVSWTVPSIKGIILILAISATAALVLYGLDREAFGRVSKTLRERLKVILAWVLAVAFILLQVNLLTAIRTGVTGRIKQENSARYTTSSEPNGGETIQYAPTLSYMETVSRTQKLIIPKYTLNYIQQRGINELPDWSPARMQYDTRPIVNIDDELEKDENTVVVKRKVTLNHFLPLKIANNKINVNLKFKDKKSGLRKQFYEADFKALYSFRNPFSEKKLIHFNFPLPMNSGTLSNFSFRVDGVDVGANNLATGYMWEGEVEPGKTVNVEIGYSHQGAQSWTYFLAGRREAISDFNLSVETDNPNVKFLRGVLFPTGTDKGIGRTVMHWTLKDLITSQNISLFFSGTSASEQITRLFIFSPIALAGFFLIILAWCYSRKTKPEIMRISLATLSYSAGFALASYLITPLSLGPALLISFAISGVLCHFILGPGFLPVTVLLNVSPMAFNFPGNTGIILCILGIVLLVLIAKGGSGTKTDGENSQPPVVEA